jgi:hypothetical protein
MTAPLTETLKEAGLLYTTKLTDNEHLLFDPICNKHEVWFNSKHCASFRLKYKNTHFEFARTATTMDLMVGGVL